MIRKLVSEIEKSIDASSIVISSNIQKYFGPGEDAWLGYSESVGNG